MKVAEESRPRSTARVEFVVAGLDIACVGVEKRIVFGRITGEVEPGAPRLFDPFIRGFGLTAAALREIADFMDAGEPTPPKRISLSSETAYRTAVGGTYLTLTPEPAKANV